jgi:hypothetical protein
MLAFVRYYHQVLKTACTHSLSTADLWSSVIGASCAVIVHFFPEKKTVIENLAWQIPLLALASVVGLRLTLAPVWIYDKLQEDLSSFKEKYAPKIRVFLNETTKGISESPTLAAGLSKWVQLSVACATQSPLINCETRLKSLIRLKDHKEFVEEHVHCFWSQRNEKTITVHPGLPECANLLSFYKGLPLVKLELDPQKLNLAEAIQYPGAYIGSVVVTADGVQPKEQKFAFEWADYEHMELRLVS